MINNRGTPDQSLEEARNQEDRPLSPAHRLFVPAPREALDRLGHPREVT
jgi:hypothetical protein